MKIRWAPSVGLLWILVLICQTQVIGGGKVHTQKACAPMYKPGKFLYFAYGSNLLEQRIHINNPSAVRAGIAKLDNHVLDFITYSKSWRGAAATVVPKHGSHVWGALWEIDNMHMESLDRQEGVPVKLYLPKTIKVKTDKGEYVECRVYQQTKTPDPLDKIEDLPEGRRPSAVYLETILKGAKESGLPEKYIQFLKKIPHNGYDGPVDIGVNLKIT